MTAQFETEAVAAIYDTDGLPNSQWDCYEGCVLGATAGYRSIALPVRRVVGWAELSQRAGRRRLCPCRLCELIVTSVLRRNDSAVCIRTAQTWAFAPNRGRQ
jgi:hypothetical protein